MEVEMKIRGLVMDPVTNMPIVILKDTSGNAVLPIWVGVYEANAIAQHGFQHRYPSRGASPLRMLLGIRFPSPPARSANAPRIRSAMTERRIRRRDTEM